MVIQHDDKVTFSINDEDLLKAIGTLKDMRKYLLEQKEVEEGKQELAKDLLVATETLSAFWCEHFADSGKKESGSQGQEELKESQPEIIRCKECRWWDNTWTNDWAPDYHYCVMHQGIRKDDFYCAFAERQAE